MNKKEFQDFFKKNEGKFIAGIHNYCDRWCERCNFTSKCSVYAMETERNTKSDSADNDNFAEIISENFKMVIEMMVEMAEEKGIDLEAIDHEAFAEEQAKQEEKANNHSLAIQSDNYANLVTTWFDDYQAILENRANDMNKAQNLEMLKDGDIKNFEMLNNAIDVIRWYNFQIHIKLMRALRQDDLDLDVEDPIQNDANGSAKVALIGVERALGAWGILYHQIPEAEDDILNILILLKKIRTGILEAFPKVNDFIRPGFDDV